MKRLLKNLLILTAAMLTASCASPEEVQERVDKRNASYMQLQENRGIRQQARDERIDAWYDRVMYGNEGPPAWTEPDYQPGQ